MRAMLSEKIQVNGQSEVLGTRMLVALLEQKGVDLQGRGLAVALNGSVVPRAAWPRTVLREGDAVEIVQAKQGG